MKTSIHALAAVCAAALLSACGGGGNSAVPASAQSPAPVAPPVAPPAAPMAQTLASPGVFVPSGQASTSISLVNCTTNGFSGPVALNPSQASLRIDANGDMTFTYAGSSSASIPAIAQTIVASTANEAKLEVSASPNLGSGPSFTENFYDATLEDASNTTITLRYYPDGTGKYVWFESSTINQIQCDMAATTVVSANFGDFNVRIAAATSGVTSVSSANATATFVSPIATWQNDTVIPSAQTRLNINTGVVERTPSAGGTFTALNIGQLVDPTNGSNAPYYSEERKSDRNGPYQRISYNDDTRGTNNNFSFRVNSGTSLNPFLQY
jgi:hypothetical protein